MRLEPVLVIGATGYVGGRLVPKILNEGFRVRAMARSLTKLAARPWAHHPMVELVQGDVLDLESLIKALKGCWAAYYLVHSMDRHTKDFVHTDRIAAHNMVIAAAKANLNRIIYLGGLLPSELPYSPHLESREEVGRILQSGPVPTTVLRAAMILGSGSASFEIMRYLVDRLPIMITPQAIRNQVQPICIRNVLTYLCGCLEHDSVMGQTYDICGPEIVTYERLFQIYAEEAGLPKRRIIPVPFLTSQICSYLIHLVTPVHRSLARPLTEGLRHTLICRDPRLREIIPQDLMNCRRTIRRILFKRQQQIVETTWADAGHFVPPEWAHYGDQSYTGGTVIYSACRITLQASPEEIWTPLVRIGGDTGWYYADYLWVLRGWSDKLLGGISSHRGRRHPVDLVAGDPLDFWRVLEVRPARRLLLVGEMKAPGEAVLDFRIIPQPRGATELQMIARFLPQGLGGLAYWYVLLPFHSWIFKGTLQAIARRVDRPVISGPESFKPG
ncbi:MAG: SDR family oxidoreductase [Deltaproteobacteria bacterium]|nr:SDR family oxidoreductase [Deltaproteobacteria bacterium]